MPYNVEELAAIEWHQQKTGLVVQLSVRPAIRFRNKETGEITERNIAGLVSEHKAAIKEERKAASRARRSASRRQKGQAE